ncbi:MAG: phospholipase D family protein [Candidatus Diapherotrites archaeon]|uniref:Phospholipase D family protein n=1 Tax=Candidatus Iainarchaeum sp. TaxID=3101447 RepID=A0A8T4C7R1_9ARCH|nr:phospholipase D family protein [Candidatus Diapherotrites archaeon]
MRPRYVSGIVLFVAAFLLGFFSSGFFSESSNGDSLLLNYSQATVSFCPSLECVSLPVSALDSSRTRVWVAMYSFTNEDLANALVRAHNRGVDVRVIVEKQQAGSKYSQHEELSAAGIPVRMDSNPNYMHDKFAVIDSDTLINGSMNWTGNGVSENNENVMIISSPELNEKFAQEFGKIWSESDAFLVN